MVECRVLNTDNTFIEFEKQLYLPFTGNRNTDSERPLKLYQLFRWNVVEKMTDQKKQLPACDLTAFNLPKL